MLAHRVAEKYSGVVLSKDIKSIVYEHPRHGKKTLSVVGLDDEENRLTVTAGELVWYNLKCLETSKVLIIGVTPGALIPPSAKLRSGAPQPQKRDADGTATVEKVEVVKSGMKVSW